MRMQNSFTVFVVMVALVLAVAGSALAQTPPLPVANHYKTYLATPPIALDTLNVTVEDQWGRIGLRRLVFDRFSTPVQKTVDGVTYPIIDPVIHMDWWGFGYKNVPHTIIVTDQFGQAQWTTASARYLLTPSVKNVPPPAQPPVANHYLCYDVVNAPLYKKNVVLVDQFGTLTTLIVYPMFFCNPAKKTAGGLVYPIIDPNTHLSCYRIENREFHGQAITAIDQFGYWTTQIYENDCLCLPALKDEPVRTERSTWGKIKALYRN